MLGGRGRNNIDNDDDDDNDNNDNNKNHNNDDQCDDTHLRILLKRQHLGMAIIGGIGSLCVIIAASSPSGFMGSGVSLILAISPASAA